MKKDFIPVPKLLLVIIISLGIIYFLRSSFEADIKKTLILFGALFFVFYGLLSVFTQKTWISGIVNDKGSHYIPVKGKAAVIFGILLAIAGTVLLYGYFTFL